MSQAPRDQNRVPTILAEDIIDGSTKSAKYNPTTDGVLVEVVGEVTTTSPNVQTLLDDVTTTGMTYVGTAPIGTATSASAWTIKRLDESGTPTTLVVKYATAGASTCIWDSRASLTYT